MVTTLNKSLESDEKIYKVYPILPGYTTMEITTLKLKKETKSRLDKFKIYPRETYEEVMESILNTLNLCRANPERARARLLAIDRQRRRQKRLA